jgi:hypothetical protein
MAAITERDWVVRNGDVPTPPIEFNNQPAPKQDNNYPDVWELVIDDMQRRNKFGKEKYGVGLKPFNGRNALVDAYEEALDLCVYLRTAIYETE